MTELTKAIRWWEQELTPEGRSAYLGKRIWSGTVQERHRMLLGFYKNAKAKPKFTDRFEKHKQILKAVYIPKKQHLSIFYDEKVAKLDVQYIVMTELDASDLQNSVETVSFYPEQRKHASEGKGKGWFKHSHDHSVARLSAGEPKAILAQASRDSPGDEMKGYLAVSQPIMKSQQATMAATRNPLLSHYSDFKLPSKAAVRNVSFKFEHIEDTKPIVLNTLNGPKIVEYDSEHLGAWIEPHTGCMRMDPRLKGRNNWALRKALIAHEFQHLNNDDEDGPSAVHTLLRQNLLMPKGDMIRIGTMEEFFGLAEKYGCKGQIRRIFDKSPAKTDIMKYSFKYGGKEYVIARDVAFLSATEFEKAKIHKKPVSELTIEGKNYLAMPFRYANVLSRKNG